MAELRPKNPSLNQGKYFQGEYTSEVFSGRIEFQTLDEIYNQSPQLFSDIIRSRLPNKNKDYVMADFGSHKGELISKVKGLLSDYNIQTLGIDVPENLKGSNADLKVAADLTSLALKPKSVDMGICRYVLAWNTLENQELILKNISQAVKLFAIVQHAGPGNNGSDAWRAAFDAMFKGDVIPKLKRSGNYYSSPHEVENLIKSEKISYSLVQSRRVENALNIFSFRYGLDNSEKEKALAILGDKNYFYQSTWVLEGR